MFYVNNFVRVKKWKLFTGTIADLIYIREIYQPVIEKLTLSAGGIDIFTEKNGLIC